MPFAMSALISLRDVRKSFGSRQLFAGLTLAIGEGERIGLIGANGSGKSTLLKILADIEKSDSGDRVTRKGALAGYLPQDDDIPADQTVEQVVAAPLRAQGLAETELFTRTGAALGRAGFTDPAQKTGELSGGWRKRLALARALISEPDVLLLDEPTNHLDLESILWLEKLLRSIRAGYVVVSHDRRFLENVSDRTIELGRAYPDGYLSVDGPYSALLERREDFLAAQETREQALANKVRREIEWLRRGPKARTTKAKYRIDAAGRLMDELAASKDRTAATGRARIDFTATDRKTKRLLTAEGLHMTLGGRTLFSDLDIVLSPGVRIGLAGVNGSGKTTLLRILGGEIAPDAGKVSRAPALQVVAFDQNREQLDLDVTLARTLAPHGDSVLYRDRSIHVVSWAKRFLFRPDQLELPVGLLSGGEQARILIARLMLRPADVLLLDEPSNNLDIPTLEILEESLTDFPGAVVLISHDRFLMERATTVVLGLDGRGGAEVYADFDQWDESRREREKEEAAAAKAKSAPPPKHKAAKPKKLSYKERLEWEGMEARILEAEEALEACKAALEDPAVAADAAALAERLEACRLAQEATDGLYARWEELEAKQGGE